MKITTVTGGPLDTNCYILTDEKSGRSAVIDPGFEDERLTAHIKALGPEGVSLCLLTHGHYDHIAGALKVKEITGAEVCLHSGDASFLKRPELSLSYMIAPGAKVISEPDVLLNGGDELALGELAIRVIHTPGHTAGGCCFMVGNALFTGDTLMRGSMGRTDFPTGDGRQLLRSLKLLRALDGDFRVFPGHGDATTLEEERRYNPFMNMGDADAFDY